MARPKKLKPDAPRATKPPADYPKKRFLILVDSSGAHLHVAELVVLHAEEAPDAYEIRCHPAMPVDIGPAAGAVDLLLHVAEAVGQRIWGNG